MNKININKMFAELTNSITNPTTELKYDNDFQLLVAVILSAQATDISVNKATKNIFINIKTPTQMLDFGLENFRNAIKTIGLFNTKSKNVIATSLILREKYKDGLPQTREKLEELPGVGRKTANVVLNTAFGKPTIAVDTHVFRVSNRTGLAKGATVIKVEETLIRRVPKNYIIDAHHLLILHGRYVCTAKKPQCRTCAIVDICDYKNKSI